MANYVLGPGAARRLQEMMRGRMASGRIEGDAAHVVDDGGFEHPYKLTYAASAGAVDEQTGAAAGAWIIWLPDGCLVIDGETVDLTANMTAANNYPAGWYDLTEIFDGTDPDDFDLYLDASKDDPKFVVDPSDAENPVLIAKVDGKAVKGVVESALVFSKGGNKKPFDIVTVTENDEEVKKIVRCIWMAGGNVVTCPEFTLPTGSAISVYAVLTVTPGQSASAPSTYSFAVQAVDYGEEPAASSEQGHENDSIFFAPLYDINADGAVAVDYRDALVTLDWIGTDEVSCSYGGDGDNPSYMHLKDFYNSRSNLRSLPANGHVLARVMTANGVTLAYVPLSLIAGGGGGGGGGGGDDDPGTWVSRLNGLNGVVRIVGGEKIRVETDSETNTIKISFDENKEEDEEPVDQCAHPGDDADGSGGAGGGGGVEDVHDAGGVPAEYGGTTHGGYVDCCNSAA